MLRNTDFNPVAFEEMIRHTLIEDLVGLEVDSDLYVAMCRVVAYYSVPGKFMQGKYDSKD